MNLRALAIAVVALVAFSTLAAAQSGSGGGDDSTSSTATTSKAPSRPGPSPTPPPCREGPGKCPPEGEVPAGARSCLDSSSSGPGGPEDRRARCIQEYCAKHQKECKEFCDAHPRARLCTFKPGGHERHIAYEPMADGQGFTRLTVNGVLVLESVRMEVPVGTEISSARTKHALTVTAGKNVLALHDEAGGFLRFEGPDATVTLVLPDGARHQAGPMGKRAAIEYPGRGGAALEASNMTWTGDRTVVMSGFFSFHGNMGFGEGPGGPVREKVKDALKRGDKVGAEVRIGRGESSEILAYGQVKVALRAPPGVPSAADPLRVTLSSELPEGRTIVLHINRSVLDVEAGQVQLRYFDLPDGEEGAARTEVVFRPASDLDDILDPADDAGQPEYYVVRDQDGLQVLVSVPHWSVHMVELSSLAQALTPSVLVGIAAGLGAVAVAAVALFVPRRRDD